jgi:integrase
MDCVTKRGKVYCAIISVPVDLQKSIGRKQIWRSLKTKNYSTARSQARKLLLAADQLFTQIRTKMDSTLTNAIAAEFGLDLLKFNDELRLGTIVAPPHCDEEKAFNFEALKTIYTEASKSEVGRNILEENAKLMVNRITQSIFAGKPEDLPFVSGAYEIFLQKHGIDLPPINSNDEKELMSALAQAAKLAYIIEQERVKGIRDESDLQHRLISKWQADLPPKKDCGMPVSELLEQYYAVWAKKYRKKSDANESYVNRKSREIRIIKESLIDYFGKDIGVKEMDDDKALEWRDFHVADNQLSNSSMNKYLDHVAGAFEWAADRQRKYVEFNPFDKTQLPEGVKRDKTREFSPEELQQYISLLADTYLPEYPENMWIPLIILYNGMRNNEIAQLYVDDIQEQDGIPYFRIWIYCARKQRTKVKASQRNLPIHSKLIELGFMEYVEKMRASGHDQVFPNCTLIKRTGRYYDDNLSTRLNTLVDCISTDKKLRVYSLRSNFKTAIDNKFADAAIDIMEGKSSSLDIAGLEKFVDRAFNDVMGHTAKGSTGDTTYRKVQLRLMQRIVEQAEYPIDISKLKSVLMPSV